MIFKDLTLRCVDCGRDFVFTAGEQMFYADKGLLNEPRRCPECRTWMTCLSEQLEDELLDEAKQVEERLGSVDYDVWRCGSCSHHFSLRYPRLFTRFAKCPQCGHRTCGSTDETLRAATTSHGGSVRVKEQCEFCTYRHTYTKATPRLSSSSSSGGFELRGEQLRRRAHGWRRRQPQLLTERDT